MNIAAPTQITSIIDEVSATYDLDRRTGSDGGQYGGSVDYDKDAATADIYLYRPSASHEIVTTGEQFQGVLSGLCLPSEDVQVHDRLTWGDGRYEVMDPIEHLPTPQQTDFLQLSLDRVAQPIPELID